MSTTASEHARGSTAALACVVAVAGLLAYANSFRNDFVWDDASSVLVHKHVQDPTQFFQLFREDQHAFGIGQGNFYRPLVSVSFMIDYQLATGFGSHEVSPFVFHVTNLVWHVAAALAFMALLFRLGIPRLVALSAALLYVVHPLHSEAITYISGRADPMAAAFMFAGLGLALGTGASVRGIVAAVASLLCFVAALLSKESATIFPVLYLLVLLYRRFQSAERSPGPWATWLGSLAVLGVYGWLRYTTLNFGSESTTTSAGVLARLNDVAQAYGTYIRLIFWPTNLHMERSLAGYTWLHTAFGAAALIATLGAAAYASVKKHWSIALGFAWFIASWLPISGLFPLNAPMAEHWMYVPLAGFWLALMAAFFHDMNGVRARMSAGTCVACAALVFMAMTLARNVDWRDNETLFRATLEDNPNSSRVHYNLAVTYEDLLGNLTGARRHYEAVLRLNEAKKTDADKGRLWSEEIGAHLSLGNIYLEQDRYDLAARHFQVVASLEPDAAYGAMVAAATLGLGRCMLLAGDSHAIDVLQRAVELEPGLRPEVARILRESA